MLNNENDNDKLGLSYAKLSKLGARNQLAWADNSAIVAGARRLAELQLRIYWHKRMVRWMKCKIRLPLVGYLLARS